MQPQASELSIKDRRAGGLRWHFTYLVTGLVLYLSLFWLEWDLWDHQPFLYRGFFGKHEGNNKADNVGVELLLESDGNMTSHFDSNRYFACPMGLPYPPFSDMDTIEPEPDYGRAFHWSAGPNVERADGRNVHFLTVGSSGGASAAKKCDVAAMELGQVAMNSSFFTQVHVYNQIPRRVSQSPAYLPLKGIKTGFGYWYWKVGLTLYLIEEGIIKKNDLLIYADGGCAITPAHDLKDEFTKMFEEPLLCDGEDFVGLQMGHLEEKFTKERLFQYLNATEDDRTSGQFIGGIWGIHVSDKTHTLLRNHQCIFAQIELVDHNVNDPPTRPGVIFVGTRHDQSVLSLLLKRAIRDGSFNVKAYSDLSYPPSSKNGFPIKASRRCH